MTEALVQQDDTIPVILMPVVEKMGKELPFWSKIFWQKAVVSLELPYFQKMSQEIKVFVENLIQQYIYVCKSIKFMCIATFLIDDGRDFTKTDLLLTIFGSPDSTILMF